MKRMLPILLALMLLLSACAPAGAEEEKVLNILTWADYINGDEILSPFTAETGIKINYDYFDSNEEMLIKLQAVQGGTYDIVLASDYIIDITRKLGLLLPLDKSKLTNWDNLDPRFLNQFYDENSEYTVPYVAGTPLILYDPALVDIEITGYESLWDPSLKDSVTVMDDGRNIIGITLKTLRKSFNETDPEVLKAAEEKLMLLKPNIRVLDYNTTHQVMISGEASVGYMFTPAIIWALQDRPDLQVVYPKEGMGYGIDNLFIPVKAPHPDNAHQFLNFLLRPEIGATIAQSQWYMNCNKAAEPLLSEEYVQTMEKIFDFSKLGDTEFIQDVGDAQLIFNDIWTRFKQE